jgi:hypothetical protein
LDQAFVRYGNRFGPARPETRTFAARTSAAPQAPQAQESGLKRQNQDRRFPRRLLVLDLNGNGQWDGTGGGDWGFYLGNSSYTPVVGDWNGSGTSKPSLFLNGTWYFDTNGHGCWEQSAHFGQEVRR